jgi:hypothetical protein
MALAASRTRRGMKVSPFRSVFGTCTAARSNHLPSLASSGIALSSAAVQGKP